MSDPQTTSQTPPPPPSDSPDSSPRSGWSPRRSRATIPVLAIGVLGVVLVLYAWRLWPFTTTVQSTEDAYVRGAVTMISPKVDGYVVAVPVQDFQQVAAGQLLVQIDDRILRQRLEQARANLASQQAALANSRQQRASATANIGGAQAQIANAQAQLNRAEADMRRAADLAKDGSLSLRERDAAVAALEQARAGVAQARAQREVAGQNLTSTVVGRGSLEAAVQVAQATVRLAEIDLQNTRVTAAVPGRLGEVGVRLGQYVTPGAALASLVSPPVWIIANMKETQMRRVRPGQLVTFRVDALGGVAMHGRVERISPAAGSEFSVLRPDNATGNFVKVAQRIPVRIRVDPNQPLADRLSPGMSVVVSIHTAGGVLP